MDYQAIRQELTSKNLLIAVAYGIIMGLVLQAVIIVFGRWRYMPLLFVLIALIFVLAEIYWFNRPNLHN
jgi:predicted RND superfamily exporter protein